MAEAGLFERDDGWRVELIEGELIAVAPQSAPHFILKSRLIRRLGSALSDEWFVVADADLVANDVSSPQPDAYVYPAHIMTKDLSPKDVVFLIEVGLSSLKEDLGRKAALYAAYGVHEYWVFDYAAEQIVIHRTPGPDGYGSIRRASRNERLTPSALPDFSVAFDDVLHPF